MQVIKEDSKPEFLSLANEVDFGRMRECGFRDETASLFQELSSNHSRRDEFAVVVIAPDRYSRVSFFAHELGASVVVFYQVGVQIGVGISLEFLQAPRLARFQLPAKVRPVLNLRRHAPRTGRGGRLGSFDQLIGDLDGYAHGLDLALTKPPQHQTGSRGRNAGFKCLK